MRAANGFDQFFSLGAAQTGYYGRAFGWRRWAAGL